MMLTVRADRCKPHKIRRLHGLRPYSRKKTPCVSLYKYLEINLVPIKFDLDLEEAKELQRYFFIATMEEERKKDSQQQKKQFLNYFQRQFTSSGNKLDPNKSSGHHRQSFGFSEEDQRIGTAMGKNKNNRSTPRDNFYNPSDPQKVPPSPGGGAAKHKEGTCLSDEKYFHRIRIGKLGFDISFTGWKMMDIHTKILVSSFDCHSRLSTWTKLMETL